MGDGWGREGVEVMGNGKGEGGYNSKNDKTVKCVLAHNIEIW